jgi:hypothetical protein
MMRVVDGKEQPRQQGILTWCFAAALEEMRYDCTHIELKHAIDRQFARIKHNDLPRMDQEVLLTFSMPHAQPGTMRVLQPLMPSGQRLHSGQAMEPGQPQMTAPPVVPPPPPGFIQSQQGGGVPSGASYSGSAIHDEVTREDDLDLPPPPPPMQGAPPRSSSAPYASVHSPLPSQQRAGAGTGASREPPWDAQPRDAAASQTSGHALFPYYAAGPGPSQGANGAAGMPPPPPPPPQGGAQGFPMNGLTPPRGLQQFSGSPQMGFNQGYQGASAPAPYLTGAQAGPHALFATHMGR